MTDMTSDLAHITALIAHYSQGLYTRGEVVAAAVSVLASRSAPAALLARMQPEWRALVVAHLETVDPDTCVFIGRKTPTRTELKKLQSALSEAGMLTLSTNVTH